MGIEPTMPLLSQSIIGFEDRGRHQSGTRFHRRESHGSPRPASRGPCTIFRMRYQGSCHCGAVRFAFDAEPITEGIRCNCSICRRRGFVLSKSSRPDGTVEGLDRLVVYHWGDRMVNHWFCPTCGISPFSDAIDRPGIYRVNLGCVDGLDPYALAVTLIDGASY